jgi:DNA recombination protein RmuC
MIGARTGGRHVTDHLLIGILIGVVCGIAALLVMSVVTLRRFDLEWRTENARMQRALSDLQKSWERTELGLRDQIETTRQELELATRDARDEASSSAGALRDEIAGGLKGVSDGLAQRLTTLTNSAVGALRDHPMPALTKLAEAQEEHLRVLAAELQSLAGTVDTQLDDVRSLLGERLRQIQTDHRDGLEQQRAEAIGHAKDLRNEMVESAKLHLEQVRSIVDANLDTTLERRLGDRFRLVTDRLELVSEGLEQVHRGLGEVQSFATGVSDLQRALVRVRLGGTRMVAPTAVESAPAVGAKTPRRRRKTDATPTVPAAGESADVAVP